MRPSAVLFLVAVSAALAGGVTIKSLRFPAETSTSYVELTSLKPLELTAFTLCLRVATELTGARDIILFAYRTADVDELNVWRNDDGRLALLLKSSTDGVFFRVPELSGLETHLCVTWDSASGATALFMDGRKTLTKTYRKGHTVVPGGRVILGQDPDNYLGSFDAAQCFVGELSDVNLWDTVLSDSTITDMYSGKRVQKANVFDWETIQFKVNGDVEVVDREM